MVMATLPLVVTEPQTTVVGFIVGSGCQVRLGTTETYTSHHRIRDKYTDRDRQAHASHHTMNPYEQAGTRIHPPHTKDTNRANTRTDVGLPDEGGEDHGSQVVEEAAGVALEAHHPVDDHGEERGGGELDGELRHLFGVGGVGCVGVWWWVDGASESHGDPAKDQPHAAQLGQSSGRDPNHPSNPPTHPQDPPTHQPTHPQDQGPPTCLAQKYAEVRYMAERASCATISCSSRSRCREPRELLLVYLFGGGLV